MSAFSTVGDVFTVPDFLQPLAMLTCGAVVVWTSLAKTALASSPCLSARTRGESRHSDVTFLDNADLGFAPSDVSAHFPVFLHLLERAAGKQDRKRLRKRLAQEFSPSASSTQPQAGGNPTIQQPTGTAPARNLLETHRIPRPIRAPSAAHPVQR